MHELVWLPPMPLLFQRRYGAENRPIPAHAIRKILHAALAATGLTTASGTPLTFTPHDFRRLWITEAIMHGMPPHIAQLICGHQTITATMGYKAVYPEEAINGHRAFIARRRAVRPSEEYRTPTDEEWAEFLGHFERRKVALGDCGRAWGSQWHPRAQLPQVPPPPDRPRPAAAAGRHPRQPAGPHHRSRTRGLAWRSRRTQGQPRRRGAETRPAQRPRSPACHRPSRNPGFPRHRHPDHHHARPGHRETVMTAAVTAKLLHHLVASSHAEGVTDLAVEAAIGHDDNDGQILLVAGPRARTSPMTPGSCPPGRCCPARPSPAPCTPPSRPSG